MIILYHHLCDLDDFLCAAGGLKRGGAVARGRGGRGGARIRMADEEGAGSAEAEERRRAVEQEDAEKVSVCGCRVCLECYRLLRGAHSNRGATVLGRAGATGPG